MRIISITFIALLTCAPALANGADPRISTDGMQSLYISYDADRFKTPTLPAKTPAAAPPKPVPEIAMSNAKMKAIWDDYKALVQAQSAMKPKDKAAVVKQQSFTTPTITQASKVKTPSGTGFGASGVIERYQKAREASQHMQSLRFDPPKSLQKSQ